MPYYAKDGNGIPAVPPEQVEARIPGAKSAANAAEGDLDEALINYGKAKSGFEQAESTFERATARDKETQRYSPGSDEANQAYEEWLAASRETRAEKDALEDAVETAPAGSVPGRPGALPRGGGSTAWRRPTARPGMPRGPATRPPTRGRAPE